MSAAVQAEYERAPSVVIDAHHQRERATLPVDVGAEVRNAQKGVAHVELLQVFEDLLGQQSPANEQRDGVGVGELNVSVFGGRAACWRGTSAEPRVETECHSRRA